jgi:hypothetical protein
MGKTLWKNAAKLSHLSYLRKSNEALFVKNLFIDTDSLVKGKWE